MAENPSASLTKRFTRSARLDTDLGNPDALEGYILQTSVRKAFETMARSSLATGQGAFTWTGPYGGGKSSAALAFAAALGPTGPNRDAARKLLGLELTKELEVAFGLSERGKHIVGLTGRRAPLTSDLARILAVSEDEILDAIRLTANNEEHDGLIIIVDEIGKYLEHASLEGGDIHLLQDLAEISSRSSGRLILLGILHQSFEQYANRLIKSTREEWAKIQGRFHDIPFVSASDEAIELLAKAIDAGSPSPEVIALAEKVGSIVRERRSGASSRLELALGECVPLHPVVALLIGSIARHRFGQNERSVFGFLSSGEPLGFSEFLTSREAADGGLYTPDRLFDYLRANLGPAILASPEGHRFSINLDAIERASAKGGRVHERLTKAAALIEQFGSGTGLVGNRQALSVCLPDVPDAEITRALRDLTAWAVLVYRKHTEAYSVHSGSDFDLDAALEAHRAGGKQWNVAERLAMSAVVAKRHYFETGALRWWDVAVYQLPDSEVSEADVNRSKLIEAHRSAFEAWGGSRGRASLVLLVKSDGISEADLVAIARSISYRGGGKSTVVGVPAASYFLRELASELQALEVIAREHPQLEGDSIARREVSARIIEVVGALEQEVRRAFASAKWFADGQKWKDYDFRPLSEIASSEADLLFPSTPIIRSELINRERPSSNAAAALRVLLHAMVENGHQPRLGIEGFPPEYALYATLLEDTGIHSADESGVGYRKPTAIGAGKSFVSLWSLADELEQGASIAELYKRWAAAPFGMKAGPMPVMALAWILANQKTVALYVDGLFCPVIDDIVADRLLQSPEVISVRHVKVSQEDDAFLLGIGSLVGADSSGDVQPLDAARGLVRIITGLPKWTQRTHSVSELSRKVRDATLKANDPHKLIFDDLSESSLPGEDRLRCVDSALQELQSAYPAMLDGLRRALASSLGVNDQTFTNLKRRAAAIQGISGELRLDAFALRIGSLEDAPLDMEVLEGLSSFLIHKPSRNWTDQEVDRAHSELQRFCRQFREVEALAQARGRGTGAEAISLVCSSQTGEPKLLSFEVSGDEAKRAALFADQIMTQLAGASNVESLAALAEVIRRFEGGQHEIGEEVLA